MRAMSRLGRAALVPTALLAVLFVGGVLPDTADSVSATQRLCGGEPCDGQRARGPLSTRETTDRNGSITIGSRAGEIQVPATVKRWGVWRVASEFTAGDVDETQTCLARQLFDVGPAQELVAVLEGNRVGNAAFGAGIRDNLKQVAARTLRHAESDQYGWSQEWEVTVPAGQTLTCWVMDGVVEITPRFDEVDDDAYLKLLGTPDDYPEEMRATMEADAERFTNAQTVQALRKLYEDSDSLQVRTFLVASEKTAVTTFAGR